MENNRKTLLLTLALVFIGVFLLASVFSMRDNNQDVRRVDSTRYHQNSNNYGNYDNVYTTKYVNTNPTRTSYTNRCNSRYGCSYNTETKRKPIQPPRYTQYSNEEGRKGFLGDYVKEYSVNVKNVGNIGRYYTVVFELEDKNGYEFSHSQTQYLRDGESKKFVYRDIQYERNEILHWSYSITPLDY